ARPLAEVSVDLASRAGNNPVVVRAPASKVVSCSFADRQGSPLPIDGAELFFGPHVGFGHSNGCVNISVYPDVPLAHADALRFVWPDGADSVSVTLKSEPVAVKSRSALGGARLKRPDETCKVQQEYP